MGDEKIMRREKNVRCGMWVLATIFILLPQQSPKEYEDYKQSLLNYLWQKCDGGDIIGNYDNYGEKGQECKDAVDYILSQALLYNDPHFYITIGLQLEKNDKFGLALEHYNAMIDLFKSNKGTVNFAETRIRLISKYLERQKTLYERIRLWRWREIFLDH